MDLNGSSPSPAVLRFALEREERITAGPAKVLLRLAGRWYADAETTLGPAALLLPDGQQVSALPAPGEAEPTAAPEGRAWRAAFAVPASALEEGIAALWLQAGESVVALEPVDPGEVPVAPSTAAARDAAAEGPAALR